MGAIDCWLRAPIRKVLSKGFIYNPFAKTLRIGLLQGEPRFSLTLSFPPTLYRFHTKTNSMPVQFRFNMVSVMGAPNQLIWRKTSTLNFDMVRVRLIVPFKDEPIRTLTIKTGKTSTLNFDMVRVRLIVPLKDEPIRTLTFKTGKTSTLNSHGFVLLIINRMNQYEP